MPPVVLRTIAEVRAWRASAAGSVGLVPTMGYLHEGHLSLVRASKDANDRTIVSIFVNPTQFGPNEDLARYPRDEARDLDLLAPLGGDAVFAPPASEIYPDGFTTYVDVEHLTARLEGASRPTHFRGVTTVVLKLLNIVQPDRAYFGRKDAQQLAVIRRMVRDLDVPVEIVGLPIVREHDGVAMSSRNVYLDPEQRAAAYVLNRALSLAERLFDEAERDANVIRAAMREVIDAQPAAAIDYISIADGETLDELEIIDRTALVSLAVRFGPTRLIDNTTLAFG
ncbi:MAG TPA: pantoate--beta-alanine ligase [Dehalococcoidia bacterium]